MEKISGRKRNAEGFRRNRKTEGKKLRECRGNNTVEETAVQNEDREDRKGAL